MAKSADPHRKTGIFFYILALFSAVGLLSLLFSGLLDHRRNPNQQVVSYTSADHTVIELKRNRGGHYVASGTINGIAVEFLLDTGATDIALPSSVAKKAGLTAGVSHQTVTASGLTKAYHTRIDHVVLGGIEQFNVPASIVPAMPGTQVLLGMSFLGRLDFSQRGDTLILNIPAAGNSQSSFNF